MNPIWDMNTILNTNIEATIDTNIAWGTIGNPIREWAYHVVHSDDWNYIVEWIVDSDRETAISTHDTALNRTLGIVKEL